MKEKGQNHKKGSNIYDRIFKENAESLFLPLLQLLFGWNLKSYKILETKVSKTVEREMDLLYEVEMNAGERMLLHLEFQTRSDSNMLYRMAEYHGLALSKYRLPIKHLVIYLGREKSRMKNRLVGSEVFEGFELMNIYDLDSEKLLRSQVPEVVLLVLLSKYDESDSEDILRKIIHRLKAISPSEKDLAKYLQQLTLLSRLRKLESSTQKIISEMSYLGVNIEEDSLYLKGLREGELKGVEKGLTQGIAKGIKQKQDSIIHSLLASGKMSVAEIAEICDVTVAEIEKIKSQMDRH
ncbi:MAG: hypothetical protein AAF990_22320 [Bacteroidota bacterium]